MDGQDPDDGFAPVKREVDAKRDEDPEDRAESAAFTHVEPVRVDLDDRNRAKALEVHVRHVKHDEGPEHGRVRHLAALLRPHREAHEQVRGGGAEGGREDGEPSALPVRERAVHDKGNAIHHGPGAEDPVEVPDHLLAAEGLHAHLQVVTPPVEEGVGRAQNEPVDGSPHAEVEVAQMRQVHLDPRQAPHDDGHDDEQ